MRILNQLSPAPRSQRVKESSSPAQAAVNIPSSNGKVDDRPIVRREKPNDLSDSAIRNRIEELKNKKLEKTVEVKKDDFVTAMPDNVEIKQKSTIVKNEVASVAKELKDKQTPADVLLKSDIANNDPKDENTQEKLRTILRSGGFSFSQKEKDTLGQILNKDS